MFTGIISGLGRITRAEALGSDPSHGRRLTIAAPAGFLDDVQLGDSIALNGACMTATTLDRATSVFTIDISAESLARTCGLDATGAKWLTVPSPSTCPLTMCPPSRSFARIAFSRLTAPVGESWELRILTPRELARFIAYKGSITVNGVSLTVNRVSDVAEGCELSINLIPHTLANTTLGELKAGQRVNLEIDLIARYVERMLTAPKAG